MLGAWSLFAMFSSLRTSATAVGSALVALGCSRSSAPAPAPLGTATPVAIVNLDAGAVDADAPAGFVKANIDYVLNPYNLPAYSGPTGSVEGTVTIEGPAAPNVTLDASKCPAAIDTYGKLFRDGPPSKPGGPRPLADAVVVIVGYEGFYVPEKNEAVSLTVNSACAYPSRTIAMTYGQRLEITNQSTQLFAPLVDSMPNAAVMVAPPRGTGDPIKLYPQRAGKFTITDRLEPFVHEDLYVFRHPLHAVTDKTGHFRIDGVPVGSLKVGVAHPAAGVSSMEVPVDVADGVVKTVNVKVAYKPAAPPPSKPASSEVIPPWKLPNE
jgi:hypothetical protein